MAEGTIQIKVHFDDAQLPSGGQGLSAYQLAVQSGFDGTVTEWLQSLVGPKGDKGDKGENGQSGSVSSNALSILDFGGTTSGDNTPALNAALAECEASGRRVIEFPAGMFSFSSQPNAINGIRIIGQGKTASYLVRNYSGNFLTFAGGTRGGGGVENIGVLAGTGTSGGYGLYLVGNSTATPDYSLLNNLYVSSAGGTFAVPLMIDGQARTSPQGVRDIRIQNSDFFAGTSAAIWIANGVGIYLDSVGTYPAGGTNGDIQVGSGSAIISMSNMNVQGTLVLGAVSQLNFSGHLIDFNSTSAANKCFVIGTRSGTNVVNAMTNSYISLV